MCGKDENLDEMGIPFPGSPPHVREGHVNTFISKLYDRITPACAGRT